MPISTELRKVRLVQLVVEKGGDKKRQTDTKPKIQLFRQHHPLWNLSIQELSLCEQIFLYFLLGSLKPKPIMYPYTMELVPWLKCPLSATSKMMRKTSCPQKWCSVSYFPRESKEGKLQLSGRNKGTKNKLCLATLHSSLEDIKNTIPGRLCVASPHVTVE